MTNSEGRMTKEYPGSKPEWPALLEPDRKLALWGFGIRHSLVIRPSELVISALAASVRGTKLRETAPSEEMSRMPHFESTTVLSRPIAEVFDFLTIPANLIDVMPPEFNIRLVEAPERLHLGARVVVQARRWGFAQRMVSEVTAFEPNRLMIDEQREGPFPTWKHTHLLEAVPDGTRMTDHIEFETPGGMLGFLLTPQAVLSELQEVFAYRERQFQELLEGKPASGK